MKCGPPSKANHNKNSRRKKLRNCASLRVPIELIRPIFEFVPDRGTLHALLLASSDFHLEAARVLYYSMTDEDRKIHMGFLKTAILNPIYAAHIHVYHGPAGQIKRDDSLWRRLAGALQYMCNLKELIVRDFCSCFHFSGHPSTLPFLLERFECQISKTHDQRRLRHFLSKQPQIRRINAEMFHDDPKYINQFPSDITPDLTHLRGSLETMATFLPGRKIPMLSWETNESDFLPEYFSVITTLTPHFAHLKYLSFGPPDAAVDDEESLVTIAPHFTALQYLELIRHRKDDIEAIRNIPTLKGVSVSMGRGSVLTLPPSTVDDIFSASPRLQFVAIEQLSGKRGKRVFKSWTQPKAGPSVYTINASNLFHLFELLIIPVSQVVSKEV